MKIELDINKLNKFDEEVFTPQCAKLFPKPQEPADSLFSNNFNGIRPNKRSWEDENPFWALDRYHVYYRLLGYISTFYNNATFAELGTRRGNATISLAFNPTNKVYTYNNVQEVIENDVFSKVENVEAFVLPSEGTTTPLGNVLDKSEHVERLLECDLIFIDVDPHDGTHEEQFFNFLQENNYKGVSLWDDVKFQLRSWWSSVQSRNGWNYYTLEYPYSWEEGNTGVICHGDQEFIIT